jgi:hypothetical protein
MQHFMDLADTLQIRGFHDAKRPSFSSPTVANPTTTVPVASSSSVPVPVAAPHQSTVAADSSASHAVPAPPNAARQVTTQNPGQVVDPVAEPLPIHNNNNNNSILKEIKREAFNTGKQANFVNRRAQNKKKGGKKNAPASKDAKVVKATPVKREKRSVVLKREAENQNTLDELALGE